MANKPDVFQRLVGLETEYAIYAPALVLSAVLGWPLQGTVLALGAVAIAYTVSGGTRAVSATQTGQMVVMLGGMMDEPEYVWEVDAALASAANRFIELFNRLVAPVNAGLRQKHVMTGEFEWHAFEPIPSAVAEHASHFYLRAEDNEIGGRCVNIGKRLDTNEYYHWAVRGARSGWQVHEFWSAELWTTERAVKTEPWPGSLWTWMRPPMASRICRTIHSPSPKPL